MVREQRHRLPPDSYRGEVTVAFTACIAAPATPFTDARIVTPFVFILEQSAQRHDCIAVIYCFMPDHLHLILHGQTPNADTRKAMIEFKQRTAFWLKQNRPGILWQKDFYDHIIRRHEDLGAQVRYIAGNPVRRGLVPDWRDYPYTGSAGANLEGVINSTLTL